MTPSEATRFALAWIAMQSRRVDKPTDILSRAEQLVQDLMVARGCLGDDLERNVATMSVGHPALAEHFRAARCSAACAERRVVGPDELREAVQHYRALFDELLVIEEFDIDVPVAMVRMGTL